MNNRNIVIIGLCLLTLFLVGDMVRTSNEKEVCTKYEDVYKYKRDECVVYTKRFAGKPIIYCIRAFEGEWYVIQEMSNQDTNQRVIKDTVFVNNSFKLKVQ